MAPLNQSPCYDTLEIITILLLLLLLSVTMCCNETIHCKQVIASLALNVRGARQQVGSKNNKL